MKKLTLLLAAAMLSSMSFAAEGVYKTALFGSSYNSKGISAYESEWSATNEGFTVNIVNANNNNNAWSYIKMGSSKKALVGSITTNAAIDKAITKIDLTIDAVTANAINSLTLKTKTADGEWTDAGTFTIAKGTQSVAIATPTENIFYQIVADCGQASSNGPIQISKVEYYITIADVPATAIALDKTTWEAEQYKYTKLTATLTPAEANTEVVWTSSDENVATVVNGNVTAVGVGTATITATAGVGVEATCVVTITDPTILTCDSAATLALSVGANNELYADGKYVVRGYVTEVAYAYSASSGNLSVWLADTKAGENTIEAYKAVPVSEVEQTLAVGDYVEVVGDLTKYKTTPELAAGCSIKKLAEPTTAIDDNTLRTPSVKTIENGQLVILRDGKKYNAMGVRLQ
ncbi:MAG: Ig-like domain-containing protein [Bacteroidales bacterium]|nr:Ig-like domain-containing protein [Bacteroidales bacterium]